MDLPASTVQVARKIAEEHRLLTRIINGPKSLTYKRKTYCKDYKVCNVPGALY